MIVYFEIVGGVRWAVVLSERGDELYRTSIR